MMLTSISCRWHRQQLIYQGTDHDARIGLLGAIGLSVDLTV